MQSQSKQKKSISVDEWFPSQLIDALGRVEKRCGRRLYIAGGTVRDWLLARKPMDLDLAVASGAVQCCHLLIEELGQGSFVRLGTETEEAARVVYQGIYVDISAFRKAAVTMEEELCHRDFTVNAMALELSGGLKASELIDPLGGLEDLRKKSLRCCPEAFEDDPLRMLRGYRLQAELAFTISPESEEAIRRRSETISRCAAERILDELDRIMVSSRAGEAVRGMSQSGLLWAIVPELKEGVGVEQPGYHHEDVFHHALLALERLEEVMAAPSRYFHGYARKVADYVSDRGRRKNLCWATIFHDLGKPATRSSGTISQERTTFYNHDRVGREMFGEIAVRLRMSRSDADRVGRLIEMHMHPFHLSNVRRIQPLSRRALLNICKKGEGDLPGLFALAMADSLAGQGPLKPVGMENELAELFDEVETARERHIEPVLHGERLVDGHDLIELFQLEPGPQFRKIFEDLEVARAEEEVTNRREALDWLHRYLGGE